MSLSNQTCKPPKAGDSPLSPAQVQLAQRDVPDWLLEDLAIKREFQFKDFREAMAFVNKVADIAEAQRHHPDIFVSYRIVRLTFTTHKIGGLSQNDFIMAAKIDDLQVSLVSGKVNH